MTQSISPKIVGVAVQIPILSQQISHFRGLGSQNLARDQVLATYTGGLRPCLKRALGRRGKSLVSVLSDLWGENSDGLAQD